MLFALRFRNAMISLGTFFTKIQNPAIYRCGKDFGTLSC